MVNKRKGKIVIVDCLECGFCRTHEIKSNMEISKCPACGSDIKVTAI